MRCRKTTGCSGPSLRASSGSSAARGTPTPTSAPRGPTERLSSIECELLLPRFVVGQRRLIFLQQDEVLEHERVHVRTHEAAVGVLGCADDWLAADIERRVDDDRAPRSAVKR